MNGPTHAESPSADGDAPSLTPLPMTLELHGRGGNVRITGLRLSPLVHVELLDIAIPQRAHDVDLSRGPRGFRHHRGRLTTLAVTLDGETLRQAAADRLHASPSALRDLRLRLTSSGEIIADGLARVGGHEAAVMWRAGLVPAGDAGVDAVLLSVYDVRVFGWLPVSGLALTGELLRLLPDSLVHRRALTHAVLRPLRPLLRQILAARGWKLPAHGTTETTAVVVTSEGIRLRFEETDDSPPVVDVDTLPDAFERRRFERFVHDLELKRHHARLDALIADGALDTAIREARRQLDDGGEHDFLEQRLLLLLVSRAVTLDACAALATQRLDRDPTNRVALLALAAVQERRGESASAADTLDRLAATLDPRREGGDLERCRMRQVKLLAERDPARVERTLQALLDLRPDCGDALEALADRMEARGDDEAATRLRGRLLAADVAAERQHRAAEAIARFHLGKQRPEEARPYLSFLETAGADERQILRLRADIALVEGRWDVAVGALHASLAIALADGLVDRAKDNAQRLASVLTDRLSRPGEAARTLVSVADRFGADPWALQGIATLYRAAGESEQARRAERQALDLLASDDSDGEDDDALDLATLRAELNASLGTDLAGQAPEQARRAFERALDALPSHNAALEGLEALASTPEHWDAIAARLHAGLDHCDDASHAATLALRLALIYSRTFGFPHEALPLLERVLELRPRDRFALRLLVELTRQLGDWRRHRAALERALDVARSSAERVATRVALAEVVGDRLGDPRGAREILEGALREKPRDSEVLARLARLHRASGDTVALVGVLRSQAALAPTPELRQTLLLELAELLLERLQRFDEAEASLDDAQRTGPETPQLTRLRARLGAARHGATYADAPSQPQPPELIDEIIPEERAALYTEIEGLVDSAPPREAVRRAASAPRVSPSTPSAAWFAALEAADAGRVDEAMATLHSAIAQAPEHRASWELLRALVAERGDADELAAVQAALAELDRSPSSQPAPALAQTPSATPPPRADVGPDLDGPDLDTSLAAARDALARGDAPSARDAAEAAVKADPDCPEALDLLATACESSGDAHGHADALARRAEIAWSPQDAQRLHRAAAEALAAVGDTERALEHDRRYLRWQPLDDEVFLRVSDAARTAGLWDSVAELLRERVEGLERVRSEGADDTVGVALSLARTELAALMDERWGEHDTALRLLDQARRDWPRNDEALERLASLLEADASWERLADVLEALVGITEERALRQARLKRLVELYRGPLDDAVAARETLRTALRELPADEAAALRRALEGVDD